PGQCKPCAHGALRIMLVSLWIAEIGEHTVTHVLGDEAAVAFDQFRAAAMIGGNDLPQVLRVKPRRKRGRTHKVAKHHRQLAALGAVRWLQGGGSRGLGAGTNCKFGNCSQHLTSMPQQYPNVPKVLIGEGAKYRDINSVLRKTLSILRHPELFEPVRNLLHCS